jgi:D-tyrosyl-tRNA(Tyr) deacylase
MRAVLQRVKRCSVSINGEVIGAIGPGLLVLLGVHRDDTEAEVDWLLGKVLGLRIFADEQDKMNRSLLDIGGGLMIVSQFTLYADARRGRRPSFDDAAPPAIAVPLYESFCAKARAQIAEVATGVFGAMMDVELVNDGPVTILLDTPPK